MRRSAVIIRSLGAAALALLLLLSACAEKTPSLESTAGSESTAASKSTTASEGTAASNSSAASESASAQAVTSSPESPSPDEAAGTELVLATLNIKHGAEGLENIAAAIREISPDIIGLQEVDVDCERSGNVDEPAKLAELAGYPYYAFAKAIPLGAGEYGTAILSRFPIENFEVTALYSGDGEPRSVGHAVVNADGVRLDVFVTHLSFEERSLRIAQMKKIAGMLKRCSRYVLLGDLNSFNIEDISYLEAAYYVNRADRRYQTFRRFNSSPDNIILSEGFTELSTGVSDAECSDHRLLYGTFRLEE